MAIYVKDFLDANLFQKILLLVKKVMKTKGLKYITEVKVNTTESFLLLPKTPQS